MFPALPLLLACGGLHEAAPAPQDAVLLARRPDTLLALELPASDLPDGAPTPDRVAITTRFKRIWHDDGLEQVETPLPVHQVFYGHTARVAPAGMMLLDAEGHELTYRLERTELPDRTTWRVRQGKLWLRLARGAEIPEPGSLTVVYPPAAAWQDALDPATSGRSGAAFALREVSLDDDAYHGLLLPAPARAVFRVQVPDGGVLAFDARILPQAVETGQASDGAVLRVLVGPPNARTALLEQALQTDDWRHERLSLAAWAGREVELEFVADPAGSALYDYVFLANPVVFRPSARPRHAVLVFVDTLRRDHLSLYGYERETTPVLEAWAEQAVVFDDARATAPWTLPSVQALLTGASQDAWGQVPTLEGRLGQAGFTTGELVANAFLTQHFDMGTGWGEYRYKLLNPADEQVDRALEFLGRYEDRDALVMVQFMDCHMPYTDPGRFGGLWAGDEPEAAKGKQNRKALRGLRLDKEGKAAVKDYLVARYDENIRMVDDELGRLLGSLGEDDVVVIFADHGEEFWDHGGVEHGHALWDELLRVPLLVRAPGCAPGRRDSPVSLLDVAPTLMDLLGQPPLPDAQGRSLGPLLAGAPDAEAPFDARARFFGGLLYGDEAWGVVTPAQLKWWSQGGTQSLYDLASDPDETTDLASDGAFDLAAFPAPMAAAMGQPVVPVWRVEGHGSGRNVQGIVQRVELRHPDGLLRAWAPPSLTGDTIEPRIEEGALVMESRAGMWLPREVFVLPAGDPLDPTEVTLTVSAGDQRWTGGWDPRRKPPSTTDGRHHLITTAGTGMHRVAVDLQLAPVPPESQAAAGALGEGVADHLKALGYLDE
ncbi:MAG: sulfatase [Pseudomonadota bacterium]